MNETVMGPETAAPWNNAPPVALVAFVNVKFTFPLTGTVTVDTNA
jgi:hypothetical protein